MSDPFVLIGLARSRERWFSDLARWSTSAVAPIEYVKCLTVEETRAVIGSGRRVSALLVDAGVARLDRELIALATSVGAASFVVADPAVRRDWDSLGCAAVLSDDFGPDELIEQLTRHAHPVDRSRRHAPAATTVASSSVPPAPLIGVAGAGGTGVSTIAMGLAQGWAPHLDGGRVALADGRRVADLAMYHDVGDVIPGLPELVEAHRVDEPDPEEVRALLFAIEARDYDLLLGQRRSRDGAAMRPGSVLASIAGLRRSYDAVVVDHDAELDGEAETGSIDIEELHALSRAVAARADLVLLVGRCGVKGLHDLVRLVDRYADAGVPRERLVPVVNSAPRHPATRAGVARVLAELTHPVEGAGAGAGGGAAGPLFVRHLRGLEDVHRSASRLPDALTRPLGRAVGRLLLEVGPRNDDHPATGVRIRPGELATRRVGQRGGGHSERRSDVA
jgi:hypothetical protein